MILWVRDEEAVDWERAFTLEILDDRALARQLILLAVLSELDGVTDARAKTGCYGFLLRPARMARAFPCSS